MKRSLSLLLSALLVTSLSTHVLAAGATAAGERRRAIGADAALTGEVPREGRVGHRQTAGRREVDGAAGAAARTVLTRRVGAVAAVAGLHGNNDFIDEHSLLEKGTEDRGQGKVNRKKVMPEDRGQTEVRCPLSPILWRFLIQKGGC